ncbi:MAG: hypothetical protein AAGI71_18865 [Bacteroidota bacterium]
MDLASLIVGLTLIATAVVVLVLAWLLARGRWSPSAWHRARLEATGGTDETWHRVRRYAGRRFMMWSIPVLLAGAAAWWVPAQAAAWLVFAPVLYVVPCIEAVRYARRLEASA